MGSLHRKFSYVPAAESAGSEASHCCRLQSVQGGHPTFTAPRQLVTAGVTLRSGGDPDDLAGSATGSAGANTDLIYLKPALCSRRVKFLSGPADHAASTPRERSAA